MPLLHYVCSDKLMRSILGETLSSVESNMASKLIELDIAEFLIEK